MKSSSSLLAVLIGITVFIILINNIDCSDESNEDEKFEVESENGKLFYFFFQA